MFESTYCFSVLEGKLDETKKVIRGLHSLRFLDNPQKEGTFYNIKVSGSVYDIHELTSYLIQLEEIRTRSEGKPISSIHN